MGDTTKGLLYACLAFIGFLITITAFVIYMLLTHVKRQFVYHFSAAESTTDPSNPDDRIVSESLVTSGHIETATEIQEEENGDGDTDSLTRNLSFSNFERPQQSADTVNQEGVENQVTTVHSGNVEHSQITGNLETSHDDKDKNGFAQNPMFMNLERLDQPGDAVHQENIENLETIGHFETVNHEETMNHAETMNHSETIQNHLQTTDHPQTIDHPNTIDQPETGDLPETMDLPQTIDNQSTTDDDKDSDVITRGLSFSTFEKLIEYAGTKKISESTENLDTAGIQEDSGSVESLAHQGQSGGRGISGGSGTLETITENSARITTIHYSADESQGPYSLTQGILINSHRHESATGHLEISTTRENAEIKGNDDGISNNDAVSAISFSKTEKQVSFSGNNSTYIVERREKESAQLIEFDETSNFEFVKYVKQQQKNA